MLLHNNKRKNGGYVALISAIIMTVILVLVSNVTSHSGFLGRFDSEILQSKDKSYALARGCLDHAKLKLAQGISYTGNETVVIGAESCILDTILIDSGNKIIISRATVGNTTTKLRLTINGATLIMVSLEEMGGL